MLNTITETINANPALALLIFYLGKKFVDKIVDELLGDFIKAAKKRLEGRKKPGLKKVQRKSLRRSKKPRSHRSSKKKGRRKK